MHDFRRLPLLVRGANILGLLLPLAALALFTQTLSTRLSTSEWPADFNRVQAIALNLASLGMCCTLFATTYRTRVRGQGREPVPPNAWQRLVRVLVVTAALPLCALTWAVVIPSTQPGFDNVYLLSMLAPCVWFVAWAWVWIDTRNQAADRHQHDA